MRLNLEQLATIRQTVQALAGEDVRAYVFGSRLRDDARGGDLDLLLEADQFIDLMQRARIECALEERHAILVDVGAIQPVNHRRIRKLFMKQAPRKSALPSDLPCAHYMRAILPPRRQTNPASKNYPAASTNGVGA